MALLWEELKSQVGIGGMFSPWIIVYRAKVPGGWLVATRSYDSGGVTFLPDPEHEWDGHSLDDESDR